MLVDVAKLSIEKAVKRTIDIDSTAAQVGSIGQLTTDSNEAI